MSLLMMHWTHLHIGVVEQDKELLRLRRRHVLLELSVRADFGQVWVQPAGQENQREREEEQICLLIRLASYTLDTYGSLSFSPHSRDQRANRTAAGSPPQLPGRAPERHSYE